MYDKTNNLISYIEFADYLDIPKCSYSINGNVLNRIQVNEYHSLNNSVFESVNSVIEYDQNISLFPLCFDGEINMNMVASGSTINLNNRPSISSRFDTYNNLTNNKTFDVNFSVKSDLMNDYLNKL